MLPGTDLSLPFSAFAVLYLGKDFDVKAY